MFISATLVCAVVGFAAGLVLRVPIDRLVTTASGRAAATWQPERPATAEGPAPVPRPPVVLAVPGSPGMAALGALTGGVFALLAWRLGPGLDLLAFLLLAAAGVVLAMVDLRTLRLPDSVIGVLLLAGLTLLGIEALALDDFEAYARALLGAFVLAAYHFALAVFRRGSLGLGDVKLAAVLGLHLSWLGWDVLAAGAFLSFAGAASAAIVLLATRRAQWDTALPFGPWMLVGALGAVLCGEQLVAAYVGW
ncbi:prepilin peptidase [Yinghuangia soli]|uniref:A24 family peptidase n=1 Tax=Yinghuangia soli TaxID=2908204 RepID=A0AA41Q022_9ACTN|nr:A24 family peptidase [Yinghuangia soli]MCF2529060.1 A24 family peptidase [Yinghuangia soli]